MESGLSRHKNSINVALKNAADFGVSVVMFWLFGFGLMFGTSYKGIIGTDLFGVSVIMTMSTTIIASIILPRLFKNNQDGIKK